MQVVHLCKEHVLSCTLMSAINQIILIYRTRVVTREYLVPFLWTGFFISDNKGGALWKATLVLNTAFKTVEEEFGGS